MGFDWFHSGLLGVAVVLSSASTAGSQPVTTSLEDLKRLRNATTVTVLDTNGQEFRGTIADVTESRLDLQIEREIRRFEAVDVRSVRMRKEDSVANGALIGAAVGGGLTSLAFLDNECHDDPACYRATAIYGGIGAIAGAIVDALIHRSVVVYAAPSRAAPTFALESLGRMGLQLRIAF